MHWSTPCHRTHVRSPADASSQAALEKREEEAAKKRAAEEAARKKQQEEAARKKQQEEAALKKQEEEAARKKREDDARKRAAEEAAQRQEREVRPHEAAWLRFASSRARQCAVTDHGVGVAGSGDRPDSPHVAFAPMRVCVACLLPLLHRDPPRSCPNDTLRGRVAYCTCLAACRVPV